MNILWLSWKDRKHPHAGGAEVVSDALLSRLAAEGHKVVLLTAGYPGAAGSSHRHGYHIIRVGGSYSVYLAARRYVKKRLRQWPDLIVEEVNTIPFLSRYYLPGRRAVFVHMLCREVWFHQMSRPLSWLGYRLEPHYLKLLQGEPIVTISESSAADLERHGFSRRHMSIISEGIELEPLEDLATVQKFQRPTMLSLGSIRSMKRTHHQIEAFELLKQQFPDLRLVIAGDIIGRYGREVMLSIQRSPHQQDIDYLGKISARDKLTLMRKSHFITVTSIKEGWGLIVTEAASQGTPAVVYNVDGLRDSVIDGKTGLIAQENSPEALADKIRELLSDPVRYRQLRKNGWTWSKQINFDRSYEQFKKALSL